MIPRSIQATVGILFFHAAVVLPKEFSTSFIPDIKSAYVGVACFLIKGRIKDQILIRDSSMMAFACFSSEEFERA